MRVKAICAAFAVLAALIVALPQSASAGFFRRDRDYHYSYVKPRYYPAYNSHYWVPATSYRKCRKHYHLPRYYKAWGYPKRGYEHHRHVHRRHRW